MSTNSLIAYQKRDKTVIAIYCHFDGYLRGVGKVLLKHYNDITKVKALIAMAEAHGWTLFALGSLPSTSTWGDDENPVQIFQNEQQYWWNPYPYQYLFKRGRWYVQRSSMTIGTIEDLASLKRLGNPGE